MSHFQPNLVSEKNAKCKNAKNDFCKFQTGKEKRMKKFEIEKMQKFFLRILRHLSIQSGCRFSIGIVFFEKNERLKNAKYKFCGFQMNGA